jgi:hypothetical protein
MNTYIWEVASLDCSPNGNIVTCVHWRIKGTNNKNTAEVYGSQIIKNDPKNSFINYESLSKNDVIAWVKEAMGVDVVNELQNALDNQLKLLESPLIVTLPLPWPKQ